MYHKHVRLHIRREALRILGERELSHVAGARPTGFGTVPCVNIENPDSPRGR